ncbi:outer membrane protein with beta-barrel domain [Larkinella arboricola]|uniref:Outer membrane protein with beta-barrel domain n=1 Tax=Larkinella arboricola TaxID=643671 RepID=A0A327X109_LARAB|nr:outer membrane beta-barrel protein [Larkinella arboricola]RAK00056.1 outer membrane protein with beta-barrel domain [Larkinella arboricola]
MKKLLFLASLAAVSTLAQAQTEKGQGLWSGSLSFSYSSQKNNQSGFRNSISQSNLRISRGVFFRDNWLIGGTLNIGYGTNYSKSSYYNPPNTIDYQTIYPGISGFVRRYWGQGKWRVFLGGGLSVNYTRSNYEGNDVNIGQVKDQNRVSAAPMFQAGANYYLTDRIGLEASTTSSSFPFSVSGVGIGLVILTGVNSTSNVESYEAPQTTKGRWVVGGTFQVETMGETINRPGAETDRSNTFTLSPSIGWFVKKNLLLGVAVPLALSSSDDGSTFVYGINPYIKKYISDNRLRPYVSGDLSYAATRNKSNVNETKNTTHQAGLAVGAGLAYLLGDRFIVEAELGGVYFNKPFYRQSTGSTAWNGGLSATLQPSFTINYVFD